MPWRSIHVHYYDTDVDGLVLGAVQPFFESLHGSVDAAYFVRHWRHGPHLRLNVRTNPDTFAYIVLPAAEDIIGGFLAKHPSRNSLDCEQLLRVHRRLAQLERDSGPLLPLHPDNSLHVAPYDRRLGVLGSKAASDLLASFLADTTEMTFQMTRHIRAGGQRLRLACDLMTAVAHKLSGTGVVGGLPSFRSHAEAFLCAWQEGRGQRAAWERHYRVHSATLVQRVHDVIATLDGDAGSVPFVVPWVSTLGRYQAQGRTLLEAGAMTMEPPRPARPTPGHTALPDVSPFHRAFEESGQAHEIRRSTWFAVYRLALNYNYLQLTRLGITPIERFLLCHLLANAIADSYGVSAIDLARQPLLVSESAEPSATSPRAEP